jgi:hypothetical protein
MAIAGLREEIGFENDGYFEIIKKRLIQIMQNGTENGWMDEDAPYCRFDRYTLIVSSELSDNFDRIDRELPEFVLHNLKEAAKIALFMANEKGDGINYGRSLSCHGDCANLEIISSALARGLIYEKDIDTAVSYSIRIIKKTLDFWYDKNRRSFNIWWDGRSTNDYRKVSRVLEVNLDMVNHLIGVLKNFETAGLADKEGKKIENSNTWQAMEISFKNAKEKAKTYVFKRADTVCMLPLVGLGDLYKCSAYMPYPNICDIIEASPEAPIPFLVPEYTLSDGTVVRPIQYYDSIEYTEQNGAYIINASGSLTKMTEDKYPLRHSGRFNAQYVLKDNTFEAKYTIDTPYKKCCTVCGRHNDLIKITPHGYEKSYGIKTENNKDYMTPHGYITEAIGYETEVCGEVGYRIDFEF